MTKKNIFLVDGASGTGKTDLVEYIRSLNNNSGCLIKATTRQIRDYEKQINQNLDLMFYSKQRFDLFHFDYQYEITDENEKKSFYYGFYKKDLDDFIREYDNIFIIIRNIPLMRKLKSEYNKQHTVIAVYVHSDLSKIGERLKLQKLSESQIKYRLSRINKTYKDYVLNSAFFDEYILNNSDRIAYHEQIDNLIMKYSAR